MSDWDLNSRINWDSYYDPPEFDDPPTNCLGCDKYMWDEELDEFPGGEEAWSRFESHFCLCDACWEKMELRGLTLCHQCNSPVAKSHLVGIICPVCEKEIQEEIDAENAYALSEEANYPYGYSAFD